MNLKGVRALVVGMKKSGVAAVELLRREGANVRATDLKPLDEIPEARGVEIPFALQTDGVFQDCELIVLSPDVPADLPALDSARERGAIVVGDVGLAAPYLKGRTIGITGSNGKTTTTSLTGHILRESGIPVQVGGNIGVAVSAMVERSREDGWNVLELSSFQLETIRDFRADVAAVLNVTQNHLDRHHTFERYAAAKARVLENQSPEDVAILNADDPVAAGMAAHAAGTVEYFSSREIPPQGAFLCGEKLMLHGKFLMRADEVPIRGRHNLENVLAASLAVSVEGSAPAGL